MTEASLSKTSDAKGSDVGQPSDVTTSADGVLWVRWPAHSGPAYAALARRNVPLRRGKRRAPAPPTTRRGPDGPQVPILGGEAAAAQVRAVLRAAVREGKRRLADQRERDLGYATWDRMAHEPDESFLDTLSAVVPQTADESDGAYEARLRDVLGSFRARLDEPSASLLSLAPVARAGSEPTAKEPDVYVLRRSEYRALKDRIWGMYRRKPTREEMVEEGRRLASR